MSRKKPKVVSVVTSTNNGASANILLDQDRLDFIGEYGGVTFRDKDAGVVRQWLYKRLDEQKELSWHPIIQLITNRNDPDMSPEKVDKKAYFKLGIARFYLGLVPGGGILMSPWEAGRGWEGYWESNEKKLSDSELRYKHSKRFTHFELKDGELALPRTGLRIQYSSSLTHYIAYTEEMWAGVLQLIKATDELGRRLSDMIESDEGQQQLLNVGLQLSQFQLTAGEKKDA